MTGLFDSLQAFLGGLLSLLSLLLVPTTATGAVDWSLLPQQPVKVLIWFGLVFVFVPRVYGLVQTMTRSKPPQSARVPARPKAPAASPPTASPAPRSRTKQESPIGDSASAAPAPAAAAPAAPAPRSRKSGRTIMVDGTLTEAKTVRKRKTHALYETAQGYIVTDANGTAVTGMQHDKDTALAALDALSPTRKKRSGSTRKRATPAPRQDADPHTSAFGTDPNRVYSFRYRVVELDDLIASNTATGGINPDYDATLQPRMRERAASVRQVDQMAKNLVAEAYLWDFKTLDKGAMIIGSDLMVESGNGRTLALRRARDTEQERWDDYQAKLRGQAAALGIADELEGKAAPVLVRERISDVDRAAFAREANAAPVLQMSPLEQARIDAGRLSTETLLSLEVKEDQSIDKALRAAANRGFVASFTETLPENERAMLMRKNGTLNQMGIWRMKAALFTRAFPGEAGERIAETFLEALDSDVRNFENSISATLPRITRAESLIASGQRDEDLSMVDDVAKALDMLARLREQDMLPRHFVEQANLFERELTPFQERLLLHFDEIGRKPKAIRGFFHAYADLVEEAPQKGQVDMFGDRIAPTKDQLLDRIIGKKEHAA